MAAGLTRPVLCALTVLVVLAKGGSCCPELRSCFPDDIAQVPCVNNSPEWTVEPSTVDCSIYLSCFNGIGLKNCCPIGMYFNPDTELCDDEANVECDIVPPPCPEQTTPEEDLTTTTEETVETTTEDLETTTIDVVETTTEDLETTTTEEPVETTTEELDTTTIDGAETTTEDPESPTPEETTTEAVETTTVDEGPNLDALCAAQPSDSLVELAFPEECNMYVVCQDSQLVSVETCPAGLHFNPTIAVCDSPDHAECLEFVCQNNPEGIQLELKSRNSCRQYFICVGNTTIVRFCAPGTIYDAVNGWCIVDDVEHPCERERPPPPPESVIEQCREYNELSKIPHPEKCDVYYRCLNGGLTVRQCPPGLLFDSDREQCNLKENVPCGATTDAP